MKNIALAVSLVLASSALALDIKLEPSDRNQVVGLVPFDDGTFTAALSTRDEKAPDPLLISKRDANGNEIWSNTLLDMTPYRNCFVRTPEGTSLVVGLVTGQRALKLASFDAEGELLWHSQFPESKTSSGEKIIKPLRLVQTAKNELVLLYEIEENSKSVFVVRKIDESGKVSAPLAQFAHSVDTMIVGAPGELILAGTLDKAPWLVRVSKDDPKKVIWKADTLSTEGRTYAVAKAVDGYASLSEVQARPFLSRYSEAGKLKWQKFLDKGVSADELKLTPEGGFVTIAKEGGWAKIRVIKFSPTGRVEWQKELPKPQGFRYVSETSIYPLKGGSFLASAHLERESGKHPAWIFSLSAAGAIE